MSKFVVFGVGFGKTGTTSLALMFKKHYKSEHEPNKLELINLILNKSSYTKEEYRKKVSELIPRNLNMNASQLNGILIEELVALYPNSDAKFILTIREPEEWVNSVVNHTMHTRIDPNSIWAKFREFLFSSYYDDRDRDRGSAQGQALRDPNQPYSIEEYLNRWLSHNVKIIETFKNRKDQLLIIRTDELEEVIPRIASFLDIPESTITPSHYNIGSYDVDFNSYIEHEQEDLKILSRRYAKKLFDLTGYDISR